MNPNELKMISHILLSLQNRIFLLRTSLCGNEKPEDAIEELFSVYDSSKSNDNNEFIIDSFDEDKRALIDSFDIENDIVKICRGLIELKSSEVIKDIIEEYKHERESIKKRQKSLETKKKEIEELRLALSTTREQALVANDFVKPKDDILSLQTESNERLSLVKELMSFKVDSKKQFYEYLFSKTKEEITWYERETKTQAHADFQTISFWLLKYKSNCKELDVLLRKMFDDWSVKEREIAILKKYKKLNLGKMERVSKEIAFREMVIEEDRKQKEIENQKLLEEQRRIRSAIIIQAFWRGTMVRKHLGPFKIKKKKKKGKKKKGKKKKN